MLEPQSWKNNLKLVSDAQTVAQNCFLTILTIKYLTIDYVATVEHILNMAILELNTFTLKPHPIAQYFHYSLPGCIATAIAYHLLYH